VSNLNTARSYATALRALAERFGSYTPVSSLEGEVAADRIAAWFIEQWGSRSAATVNARLNALASASGWWRDQGWITEDPLRRLKRRPVEADRTRSVDRAEVAELLGREGIALRERTLWRLLCESAARAANGHVKGMWLRRLSSRAGRGRAGSGKTPGTLRAACAS
jgi:site-specific recombinase XerD